MGDEIFIGQVHFNKNDVMRYEKGTAQNGKTLYSVFLKNGTKMRFYDQSPDSDARVMIGHDIGNNGKYGTSFSGIKGLTIEGSRKDDYYHLRDCDYYKVNVTGGGSDEVRVVNTNGAPKNATVNRDSVDNVYTVDTSHGISMSEGFFVGEMVPRTPPSIGNTSVRTMKDNLADLTPVASIVTKQNNEVREYKDSEGNTVIRVDYMNDDPEEFFAEEEVISPQGRLISFTVRSGENPGSQKGQVFFDKFLFDENGNTVKIVKTTYENGKFVSTKEQIPDPAAEIRLIGSVAPGIVIPDTELKDFLDARGARLVGRG